MKLILTNASLYWLAIIFEMPEVTLYALGIFGCVAGALFLSRLFRARSATPFRKCLSYAFLVWTYPLSLIAYEAAVKHDIDVLPHWVAPLLGIVVVIYPIGQVAVAMVARWFLPLPDRVTLIRQCF